MTDPKYQKYKTSTNERLAGKLFELGKEEIGWWPERRRPREPSHRQLFF